MSRRSRRERAILLTTDMDIERLISYEKYLPVLSIDEQAELLDRLPSLLEIHHWEKRLTKRTERIDAIFAQAYKKQKVNEDRE